MEKLGIIAGGGDAPKRLIALCQRLQRPFHVLAIKGQSDPDIGEDDVPHDWLPLGHAQAALDLARQHGVRDVVMIGRVRRPSLLELKPDALMMQKLARIGISALGDDGLLKAVAREMEAEGLRIIGVQEVFADLLMPEGVLGKVAPTPEMQEDIQRGKDIARELGRMDIGQAVAMQQGIVLGMEAIEGTDALIRRAGLLKREGAGAVLVKLKKPQQDARFDLPSLGVDSVREAADAGFAGIAAEAGATLLIDREEAIRQADIHGLFLIGIKP
jgi:DUF1009 family protein